MKRILFANLKPGDIILTASNTKLGKVIRAGSRGSVSHAILCVQYSSIIDSTAEGVQARNLQREMFEDDEQVFAFRMKEELPAHVIGKIVDFARSEVGARYSTAEAVRSVISGPKPRSRKEFCSRLVARAYESAGVKLVRDSDYCTPNELRICPLLVELPIECETVSAEELAYLQTQSTLISATRDAHNKVLSVAREIDPSVENFQDLDRLVREHPEWDHQIAEAYRDSGYLEIWNAEYQAHPWRYNLVEMERIANASNQENLRRYCVETIREAYTGGIRFAVNLAYYQDALRDSPRETLRLLVKLYDTLVRNDEKRREVARAWLLRNYPDDVKQYMERVEPHSDMWFSIVDRVEPNLGMMARHAIAQEKSKEVCSSCGDEPACDYRIINSAEAMPGVPALRLCDDCHRIRIGFGEKFELLD